MSAPDDIHPEVLRVARLAFDIGGYTARQQVSYRMEAHAELTSVFITHLNGVGGHSMNNLRATKQSVHASWLTETLLAPSRAGGPPWTPAQVAVLRALLAEKLL